MPSQARFDYVSFAIIHRIVNHTAPIYKWVFAHRTVNRTAPELGFRPSGNESHNSLVALSPIEKLITQPPSWVFAHRPIRKWITRPPISAFAHREMTHAAPNWAFAHREMNHTAPSWVFAHREMNHTAPKLGFCPSGNESHSYQVKFSRNRKMDHTDPKLGFWHTEKYRCSMRALPHSKQHVYEHLSPYWCKLH